jgi:hypothetical protein
VYLFFKNSAGWRKIDVHPTKLCSSPVIEILPQQTLVYPINLIIYERGGDEPFKAQPGRYKLEMGHDWTEQKASCYTLSDEFTLI